jgi:hypothetical protein
MPSITPSNFCNFSIFFLDQKNIFQKSHYFGRGYPYQAIAQCPSSCIKRERKIRQHTFSNDL